LTDRKKEFSPGPAMYNPKADIVLKHSPSHRLDKAPWGDLATWAFSPGPGAYNPRPKLFTESGGMIGSSGRGRFLDNGVPGPG